MADINTWIEDQKKNRLFRGGGSGSDAHAMLEISKTNRIISADQARKFTAARFLSSMLGTTVISDLVDMLECAQLCVDAKSRADYMKVAIEQWQGKLASAKRNMQDALL